MAMMNQQYTMADPLGRGPKLAPPPPPMDDNERTSFKSTELLDVVLSSPKAAGGGAGPMFPDAALETKRMNEMSVRHQSQVQPVPEP